MCICLPEQLTFIAIYYIEHYYSPIDILMWLYDMAEYRDSKGAEPILEERSFYCSTCSYYDHLNDSMEEDDFSFDDDLDDSLLEYDLSCCSDFEESKEEEYYAYSRFDKFDHPKHSKSRKDKRKGAKKTSKRGTRR